MTFKYYEEVRDIMGLDCHLIIGRLEKLRQEIAELLGPLLPASWIAARWRLTWTQADYGVPGLRGFADCRLCVGRFWNARARQQVAIFSVMFQRAAACGKLAQEKARKMVAVRTAPVCHCCKLSRRVLLRRKLQNFSLHVM